MPRPEMTGNSNGLEFPGKKAFIGVSRINVENLSFFSLHKNKFHVRNLLALQGVVGVFSEMPFSSPFSAACPQK